MVRISSWIVRTLTLALVLQAPLALAMNCSDHAGHDADGHIEKKPAMAVSMMKMPADCHEKMEMPGKSSADQSGDCCDGDCPCPTANASFIGDFSGSSTVLLTAQFQSRHIPALPLQPLQVPTPPPNS